MPPDPNVAVEELLYTLNPIVNADSQGRIFRWRDVLEMDGRDVLLSMDEAKRLIREAETYSG